MGAAARHFSFSQCANTLLLSWISKIIQMLENGVRHLCRKYKAEKREDYYYHEAEVEARSKLNMASNSFGEIVLPPKGVIFWQSYFFYWVIWTRLVCLWVWGISFFIVLVKEREESKKRRSNWFLFELFYIELNSEMLTYRYVAFIWAVTNKKSDQRGLA